MFTIVPYFSITMQLTLFADNYLDYVNYLRPNESYTKYFFTLYRLPQTSYPRNHVPTNLQHFDNPRTFYLMNKNDVPNEKKDAFFHLSKLEFLHTILIDWSKQINLRYCCSFKRLYFQGRVLLKVFFLINDFIGNWFKP